MDQQKIDILIKDLEENIYCRLRPSKISGVGVFAIRDIPKGINPFKNFLPHEFIEVNPKLVFDNPKIDSAVKDFINDMYVMGEGVLHLWSGGLNALDMSFFLNHSTDSVLINMVAASGAESFITAREIKKDEELVVDYETYAENPD